MDWLEPKVKVLLLDYLYKNNSTITQHIPLAVTFLWWLLQLLVVTNNLFYRTDFP